MVIKNQKNHQEWDVATPLRRDFSEWKHYDEFWKEEGEQAYNKYVQRLKEQKS